VAMRRLPSPPTRHDQSRRQAVPDRRPQVIHMLCTDWAWSPVKEASPSPYVGKLLFSERSTDSSGSDSSGSGRCEAEHVLRFDRQTGTLTALSTTLQPLPSPALVGMRENHLHGRTARVRRGAGRLTAVGSPPRLEWLIRSLW